MCGICGFLNLSGPPADPHPGPQMMRMLAHRGPDGDGQIILNQSMHQQSRLPVVFLGHRRLMIIDPTDAARQPMSDEDRQVWVVFNGEVYNFRELREDLQKRGHVFRSRSDTEVLVHAYQEFSEDFVVRLDGMFAFALWDERQKRLILGRDRSGKKPLYYTFDGDRFTFASEIKSLLVCPWVRREIAVDELPTYLRCGYVPTPRTMYRGILQVPPASIIVVDSDGLRGPHTYWELQFPESGEERRLSLSDAAGRVREMLTASVARRLISDVPLGALLSGGLDSSAVVGIMAGQLKEPVRTFSVGFDGDPSYDERPYAAIVARHFKTQHTEFVVRADAASLSERLLWHHDQPYGDSSAIPTYLVCKLARQHVTVALNGDGGDEVFAGYDRFRAALIAERMPHVSASLGLSVARLFPGRADFHGLRNRLERFFEQARDPIEERFLGWVSYFSPSMLGAVLNLDVSPRAREALIDFGTTKSFNGGMKVPLLQKLLYLNFVTYLPDDLHVKMDRMSMANGLEVRSPMLDTALVEFVATLPPRMKIHNGKGKYVLRSAMKGFLPSPILGRKKRGFGVPLGRWFRGDLRVPFEELVLSRGAPIGAYIRQRAVGDLFQEHVTGAREHGQRLWVLFNLGLWLRMLERSPDWTPAEPELAVEAFSRG
ncbi:MAG TPA: asparagine synthase (glutamine-hydrolyzing) [Nitrospiraceae bacterium]|nr:asparagine synthase (glutamine-hydrolyzing) [Nitrospiraceae bacterium]